MWPSLMNEITHPKIGVMNGTAKTSVKLPLIDAKSLDIVSTAHYDRAVNQLKERWQKNAI